MIVEAEIGAANKVCDLTVLGSCRPENGSILVRLHVECHEAFSLSGRKISVGEVYDAQGVAVRPRHGCGRGRMTIIAHWNIRIVRGGGNDTSSEWTLPVRIASQLRRDVILLP
ncbi:hypothetical protein [Rhizobium jaguaris]|uniref:hypothetical protein n=1 Tax=Rhizobium jaguaris TaxID=1312183 RepID=UPI0039BF15FD